MALPTNIALRVALWEAYSRRCVYCSEPLKFRDLEVDHLIPQRMRNSPDELARVLLELGLPPRVDLDDRFNLVPAHGRCNGMKPGSMFRHENIRFYLEVARQHSDRIQKEEECYLRESQADRVTAALILALERGEISKQEVREILDRHQADGQFEILKEVPFSNRVVMGLLSSVEVASLLDEPLLPRVGGLDELKMRRNGATVEERRVTTCREWETAITDGFYAATTYDIKEEAFFRTACSVIHALSVARVSSELPAGQCCRLGFY